jgi:hypothetical protein
MSKLITILLILILFGCDIPGKITIKNISNYPAGYRFEVVEDEKLKEYNIYNLSIDSRQKSNEITIMFGFGKHWTDKRIKEYSESLSFLEITTYKDTTNIINKDELFNFFKERRKGLFKQEIKIIIK